MPTVMKDGVIQQPAYDDYVLELERKHADAKAEIERLLAIRDAAILYEAWARETGDYPHDERGCEAHRAIVNAIRAYEQNGETGKREG